VSGLVPPVRSHRRRLPAGRIPRAAGDPHRSRPILGANAAVELGDEIQQPRRNIPLSFIISIPIVVAIYVAIGVVTAGIAPWSGGRALSLAEMSDSFMARIPFLFFLLGGGFLAVVTTLNATCLWGT